MKVLVSTDSSPEETFWSVHDTCTNPNQLIMEGGPYNTGNDKFEHIGEVMCVPAGSKYKFTIQHVRSLHFSVSFCVFSTHFFPSKELN